MAETRANLDIPKELPLLKELVESKGRLDLSNTILFGVQHLLGSNIPLFLALNKLGLAFSSMFVIGKVYSTNPEVAATLKKLGIYAHPDSLKLDKVDLTRDYHEAFSISAKEALAKAIAALEKLPKPRRLLILDDGGAGIIVANEQFDSIKAEVVAVEQTRSGAEIIRTLKSPSFPIINVAESEAKLVHESPYIATSVLKEMKKKLDKMGFDLSKAETLVVGYGVLGTEIAKQFYEKGVKVTVYDLDNNRLKEALEAGLITTDLQKRLSKSNLVIGAVGKSWLPKDFTDIARDETFLVSASSSNVEFLGLQVENQELKTDFERVHADYKVKIKNGYAWILNAGFPINFDGSVDPIPPNIVQLTRALMLAGVYDSIEAEGTGLLKLSSYLQKFIIDNYK